VNRTEVKLDGIWGGGASYPGKPSCADIESCRRYHKTEPIRRPRSGEGAEGGRSTGSTEDSGPKKPGNRVEEKALKTRKVERDSHTKPGCPKGRHWDMGSRGREGTVTARTSRYRVARKKEGTRKPEGDDRDVQKGTNQKENLRGQEVIRFRPMRPLATRQSSV
jgi:hypothetical protein